MSVRKVLAESVPLVAPTPSRVLHDIPTVAELMSTTTWAVRELCRSGRLKHIRIGHRWLISTRAIEQFVHDAERDAA